MTAPQAETVLELKDLQTYFFLDSGTIVSGTMYAFDEPVPYAYVELLDEEDRFYGNTLTDDQGWFSVVVSESVAR